MSARNPLARESDISLEVLAEQPMVVLDTPGNREYVRNYFAMHGLEPRVRHKTKTYEMARGLISTGNSYTFGFVPLKNRQTYDGSKVSYLRVKEQAPDAHIGIVMSKNCRPSRIARAFREECRRQLGSIANWETRRRTGRAGGRARA